MKAFLYSEVVKPLREGKVVPCYYRVKNSKEYVFHLEQVHKPIKPCAGQIQKNNYNPAGVRTEVVTYQYFSSFIRSSVV
jgi:hypothetical protein